MAHRRRLVRQLLTLAVEQGVSRAELAKQLGIGEAAIGKWESGTQTPHDTNKVSALIHTLKQSQPKVEVTPQPKVEVTPIKPNRKGTWGESVRDTRTAYVKRMLAAQRQLGWTSRRTAEYLGILEDRYSLWKTGRTLPRNKGEECARRLEAALAEAGRQQGVLAWDSPATEGPRPQVSPSAELDKTRNDGA